MKSTTTCPLCEHELGLYEFNRFEDDIICDSCYNVKKGMLPKPVPKKAKPIAINRNSPHFKALQQQRQNRPIIDAEKEIIQIRFTPLFWVLFLLGSLATFGMILPLLLIYFMHMPSKITKDGIHTQKGTFYPWSDIEEPYLNTAYLYFVPIVKDALIFTAYTSFKEYSKGHKIVMNPSLIEEGELCVFEAQQLYFKYGTNTANDDGINESPIDEFDITHEEVHYDVNHLL